MDLPLLTLTSDIGQQDFLVGAIKGQILQINNNFLIIDITHQLVPFNYQQASYICKNALPNFQKGTFHLILFNLFNENTNHLLLAKHNGHYFGCADNGLLNIILEEPPQNVVALSVNDDTAPKNTIDCIKIFAKAFDGISKGKNIEDIGDANVSIQIKEPLLPNFGNNWLDGQIVFIDNFENVIVNITKREFEEHRKGRTFKIVFKRDEIIEKISTTYADVAEGEKLALFNSAGYLEIAINKGNAAGLFGLQSFSDRQQTKQQNFVANRLFYQTVKIYFE
jgi:S-adenosylmethionine hydrolase